MIPFLEEIEKAIADTCELARKEADRVAAACADIFPQTGELLNDEQRRLVMALSRLRAIGLIDKYENVSVGQQRGVIKHKAKCFLSPKRMSYTGPKGKEALRLTWNTRA